MTLRSRDILTEPKLDVILQRMLHQVLERHPQLDRLCLIGLQPRGVFLARRLRETLLEAKPGAPFYYGELDATFHRDDFRRGERVLIPAETRMDFLVEGKEVILIDDVLYTGRTVRAALSALLEFGRADEVELLVLVDRRRRRDLPIKADYVGVAIDTMPWEHVEVDLPEEGPRAVRIEAQSEDAPSEDASADTSGHPPKSF